MTLLLRALTGSRAYGLDHPDSDYDWKEVHCMPTSTLLALPIISQLTVPTETANIAWEVGHYLTLAAKSNPTALEVLCAPNYAAHAWGREVRALFPAVWSSRGVYTACIGFADSQQQRFLARSDKRSHKLASNWLRVLYQGTTLLTQGIFPVDLRGTEVYAQCLRFKTGDYERAEVLEACAAMERRLKAAYHAHPGKKTDYHALNRVLLAIRRECWL